MLRVQIRFRWEQGFQDIRPGDGSISVREDDFPATIELSGPAGRGMELQQLEPQQCFQIDSSRKGTFTWRPFLEEEGETAFGYVKFRVDEQEYIVNVKPSILSEQHWNVMLAQVQNAADALVTTWRATFDVRLPRDHTGVAKKFSPAVAEVEISKDWRALEGALSRIARRPRSEIGVPRPARTLTGPDSLPGPVRTTDVYENRVVAGSVRKLSHVLQLIAARAEKTYQAGMERRTLLQNSGKGAITHADERVRDALAVRDRSRARHQALCRLRRDLPAARPVSIQSIHMTSRIRMHPDYHVVTKVCGHLGREKYTQGGRDLGRLPSRRASSIYEYWCVFALCIALKELGYRPDLHEVAQLVREDLFELEIRRHRPILFHGAGGAERLSLWYDRQATFVQPENGKRVMSDRSWESFWQARKIVEPGLYGRRAWTPDFWFELRSSGGIAVAPGDAIFDDGGSLAPGRGVVSKAETVRNSYLKGLALVDESGQNHCPKGKGLVVFCGDGAALGRVEDAYEQDDVVFLPLVPAKVDEGSEHEPITVSEIALARLKEFLEDMRSNVG